MILLRHSVDLDLAPDAAFAHFVQGIHRWWPIERFSYGGGRTSRIVLQAEVGGRFFERFADGDELHIGDVLTCDPPVGITFTWRAPGWPAPTQVDVAFTPKGAGTRIDVVHHAFERLGPIGDGVAEGFDNGWPSVLRACAAAAPA